MLRTRAPLYSGAEAPFLARLACVRHAASVRSEPGSNSPLKSGPKELFSLELLLALVSCAVSACFLSKLPFAV